MIKTIELTLSGRVQGVGMRFFINRTATRFGIHGFVKNLYNDKVLTVIQGEQDILTEFIRYIKKNCPGYIDDIALNELDTELTYKKFKIKLF